jgi:hypothetical protein
VSRAITVDMIKACPSDRRFDRAIVALPTIESGHFGNLKLAWSTADSEYRLWVSRMTREDGARFDRAIEVEHRYTDHRASWGWRTFDRPNPTPADE